MPRGRPAEKGPTTETQCQHRGRGDEGKRKQPLAPQEATDAGALEHRPAGWPAGVQARCRPPMEVAVSAQDTQDVSATVPSPTSTPTRGPRAGAGPSPRATYGPQRARCQAPRRALCAPPERDPGRASMGGREPPRCCCAGTAAHKTAPGPAAEDDRDRITTSWAAPARRQGCCHCRGSSVQGNHRGPLGLLPTVGAGEPPTAAGAAPTTVTLTRQMRFWAQTVKDVKSHRHTSKGHTALRVCLKTLHVLKENADDSANVA